ncbi:calcium and integrin-binding family member 2-like [Mizuhopecten yessoensis]|uniref:Calcium and integrin-binding family member 3 n=1 Tax=Mizuhopecten yessoensis TaxID=6573 RepID=A0A210QDS5_MIZYE|nr:calcium and integrin-binding family member 2-like [Mizuhopecten yessoensis]OWF46892.1 Calcium and integrin-binding family member 3 [Mizuhopecten yessoensis]
MGNKITTFSEDQLDAYQDCTFFTRKEILRIFRRFQMLYPEHVPLDMKRGQTSSVKIPLHELEKMPELKENPFRHRLCQVFSEDGSGDMSFDDFLDMFSVLSEAAPRDIKTVYAFKMYDFDCDHFINRSDLEKTLVCLTKEELSQDEKSFVVDKVLEETDLDDDGMLSYIEFEQVISRSPDFLNTFHIRI